MKTKLSLVIIILFTIALLMPAIAGAADFHFVQVMEGEGDQQPMVNSPVTISIQTPLGWVDHNLLTDQSGTASVWEDVDPLADHWSYSAGEYEGPDENPDDVDYPKHGVLLNGLEDPVNR